MTCQHQQYLAAWSTATRIQGLKASSACAGGVGLAAIQRLMAVGVRPSSVVGTAGSPAKRGLLRSFGLHCAISSRTTAFAWELAARGVAADIVVNTLTSPGMLAASLAGLALGGSIVELSKRCAAVMRGVHVAETAI